METHRERHARSSEDMYELERARDRDARYFARGQSVVLKGPPSILVERRAAPGLFPRSWASLSRDGRYRYLLERRLADRAERDRQRLLVVMLNPSTADEQADDPTITRLVARAQRMRFGSLLVANLFALRATEPRALKRSTEPGDTPLNDHFLREEAARADAIIVAWGAHGDFRARARDVEEILRLAHGGPLWCLGVTRGGHPKHPLYIATKARLEAWLGYHRDDPLPAPGEATAPDAACEADH